MLNDIKLDLDENITSKALILQENIREKLPSFNEKAYSLISDVHSDFTNAINQNLKNDKNLQKNIDNLQAKILELLPKTLLSEDENFYFYHTSYNNLKADGEKIGKDIFYSVLGDSIKSFSVIKNYKVIKKVANNEWKVQKRKLRTLEAEVCQFLTDTDKEFNEILESVKI
ncbi:MAG: hypothetical protein ACK5LP_08785 [Campylobacteraceae bacterium]